MFLRGINVGGHKRVKMEDLRRVISSLGFSRVETYIQSGNIFFDTPEKNISQMTTVIQNALHKLIGDEVPVFIRSLHTLNEILKQDPFRVVKTPAESKRFVCFLSREMKDKVQLPMFSPNKDVEIIAIRGADLFGLIHPYKGRSGYPGGFFEANFKVKLTTRFWETLQKMIAAQNATRS